MPFKGNRVYKNAFFLYQANLHDTESAFSSQEMRGKRVCVFILIENGLALWLLYNNKLTSVFYASVLLLIMNFVITLSK